MKARGAHGADMHHDDVLRECLRVHRRLLRVERELHAWLVEMIGTRV